MNALTRIRDLDIPPFTETPFLELFPGFTAPSNPIDCANYQVEIARKHQAARYAAYRAVWTTEMEDAGEDAPVEAAPFRADYDAACEKLRRAMEIRRVARMMGMQS